MVFKSNEFICIKLWKNKLPLVYFSLDSQLQFVGTLRLFSSDKNSPEMGSEIILFDGVGVTIKSAKLEEDCGRVFYKLDLKPFSQI